MRVLLWATTLQADILALALYLDAQPDVSLLVVAQGAEALRREPIWRVRPLRSALLERDDSATVKAARAFRPDVTVFDNHAPPEPFSPKLCGTWHGPGWKAPSAQDMRDYCKRVARLTGRDPRQPNPRFLAQCYAEADRRWRIEHWGLHPDACRVIGAAYSDLLLDPPYDRRALRGLYKRLEVGERPTVLLSFTWHFGRIFPGTWSPRPLRRSDSSKDLAFVRDAIALIHAEGCQVLICLHDRHRYERGWLEEIHALANAFKLVEVKHKSDHPDNLADLLVADVMLTNLSSFVTFFYVFGRPSVHIVPGNSEQVEFARLGFAGGIRRRESDGTCNPWVIAPTDTGGFVGQTPDEVLSALRIAIRQPDSCRERSAAWLRAHVYGIDGQTAARFCDALRELAGRPV